MLNIALSIVLSIALIFAVLFILNKIFKKTHFYSVDDVYPDLRRIHRLRRKILAEVNTVLKDKQNWNKWPEEHLYANKTGEWKIFPLYAFDVWVKSNCSKMPILTEFIKSIPGLKLATLSKLSPRMKLNPHRGWGNHSNYVLRSHYGITVPEDMCYVRVNDEKQFHKEDEWIVFDDSEEHMAENLSDMDRLVLIIDIERPSNIKQGTSDVGDSNELIEIINYFKAKN